MDEQMLMKHCGQNTQCLKAVKTGEWIGARLNRLVGLLGYTKILLVARGEFIHANPSDPIHHGCGKVTVYQDVVTLGEDFAVGPGPAFHVYLVLEKNVTISTKVDETMYVDLGRLRSFKGSQTYTVPAGVDLKTYGSVVIWCEKFAVLICPATLSFY